MNKHLEKAQQILENYLILALKGTGVRVDGETYAEMQWMFDELEQAIDDKVAAALEKGRVVNAQTGGR